MDGKKEAEMIIDYKNPEGYADFTAYLAIKNIQKEKKNMIEKILKGDIFVINRPDEEPGDPAVVVSGDDINQKSPFVTVIYLKNYKDRFENDVDIVAGSMRTARCDAIHRVHKSKIGGYIRQCNQSEIDRINYAISAALDLNFSGSADPEEFKDLREKNGKLLNEIAQLKNCLSEAEKKCSYMRDEVERSENEKPDDKEMIVMKTERDLYKRLYEETMDKLLGAKA